MTIFRNEYPRPNFRRDKWLSLNGEWEFEFDDNNTGEQRLLPSGKVRLEKKIIVPFSYQYKESGIGDSKDHATLWYRRIFNHYEEKKNVILNFNASDYETNVWINGNHVITHYGGYTPFNSDITNFLVEGENVIVVKCYDPIDPTIPRGKQSWTGEQFGCWYIANSGIWQSVWIDYVGIDSISNYNIVPNIDDNSFSLDITLLNQLADSLEIDIFFHNNLIKKQKVTVDGKYTKTVVCLKELDYVGNSYLWSPSHPNLIYLDLKLLKDNIVLDLIHTRFGMRKIHLDPVGNICLNYEKIYQKLVLDQGYWADSGLTAPSIDAIKEDIILARKLGFNGARKHQKFEDPYYYYFAEELGFFTWCEMPSSYNFNDDEISYITKEWQEIVKTAKNYTSVICYVPINESWGFKQILFDKKQQDFARSLYYLTKALDNTRLISTNDGWENLSETDIVTIHDYAFDSLEFSDKYQKDKLDNLYHIWKKTIAYNNKYCAQPMIFSEFGGIAMKSDTNNGNWGYNTGATNLDEFYARLENLVNGIYKCDFQGYCYTQLTDVQQEVNGLLDSHHKLKVDYEVVSKIFNKK